MTSTQILINLIGLAVIAWVIWYFWIWSKNNFSVAIIKDKAINIIVKGGYQPKAVSTKVGQPITLNFIRKESSPCGEEIVLPDFGKRVYLPENKSVSIEVTPQKAGVYEFTCGMNMYRGKLIVE